MFYAKYDLLGIIQYMSMSSYLDIDTSPYLSPDGILDDIINEYLVQVDHNTLINHYFRMETKEEYWIRHEDMAYHFRMCKETEVFKSTSTVFTYNIYYSCVYCVYHLLNFLRSQKNITQ